MGKSIRSVVAALCEVGDLDVLALRAEIDMQVSAREFGWVTELGAELASQGAAGKDTHGLCTVALDHVLRALLAQPGVESLYALLRVPASPYLDGPDVLAAERRLASLVARNYRPGDIARSVFNPECQSVHSVEFSACVIYELVLLSVELEEFTSIRSYVRALVDAGHPLAVLPMSLLPVESGLRRPLGAADDWTWAVPPTSTTTFDAPELHSTLPMRQRVAGLEVTEMSVEESAEVMGSAVQHWCADSNGTIAAQEFWISEPVRNEDFPAAFALLPLVAWSGGQASARLYPSSPDSVFRVLLSAAVRGSAYGHGLYGAYGRLATWRSFGGLVGTPADASIVSVADMVGRVDWFQMDTASGWFHGIAWDLAVAALRSGGQEIAVLAATDTD
ncbi:DUF6183 family protein [Streptomyces sp. NPDC057757]|uniref:DUF6183 family protein n=1 Tax=Streptomyces sp. NPDC057757 TaxID=3346241 RepID=UPI003679BA65